MFNRDSSRPNKSSEEGGTTTTKEEGEGDEGATTSRIISSRVGAPTLVKFLYTPSSSSVVRHGRGRGPFFAQTALIVLRASFVPPENARKAGARACKGKGDAERGRSPFSANPMRLLRRSLLYLTAG